MTQVGESKSLLSQIAAQTVDSQGNQIISSDTSFGASPAGPALLTQQLFGLANATFQLTPPDIFTTIGGDNQVPYWRFYESSDGVMAGTALLDATTNTWGIQLNPGTAVVDDFISFSTRSYLVNDDNLSLRQKLLTVISKTGTAGGTASQWNMTLAATYYDATDTALSTAYIGTVYDTGTWTSMSGTTTTGGSAINAAARYVDIEYKLTATATVTGSAKVTIKSCLLQTSAGGGGGSQSFLVTQKFTSSGSWVVPTGVTTLYAVYGVGAGGGGGSGAYRTDGALTTNSTRISGSGGGGGGVFGVIRDLPVSGTITIGIGAGGTGGTAASFSKPAAGTLVYTGVGGTATSGGNTTFGSLATWSGGGRGANGTARGDGSNATGGGGGAYGTATATYYGMVIGTASGTGGDGGGATATTPSNGGVTGIDGQGALLFPGLDNSSGVSGGTATTSGTAITVTGGTGRSVIGTANAASLGGGGGGGGGFVAGLSTPLGTGSVMGASTAAGGAGAAVYVTVRGATGTVGITAGNGASAVDGYGGGGGAGGLLAATGDGGGTTTAQAAYNARPILGTAGAGGDGGDGAIVIAWIA